MRTTTRTLLEMKARGERFATLTAYDAVTARLAEAVGVPLVLVGDSLGMVVQGQETTIPVTLNDMVYHTSIVSRCTEHAMVVADLPFMTYATPERAIDSATRCLQDGGAQAIKLEGGLAMVPTIQRLTAAGIPVMGHIGLTPQSVHQLGGFKVQGKSLDDARRLLEDAAAIEQAGAFSIVLECVPAALAQRITAELTIPTIGIGAGPGCDAQIQVTHDLLGWFSDFSPKHARRYEELGSRAAEALEAYVSDVTSGSFPGKENSYTIDPSVLEQLEKGPE